MEQHYIQLKEKYLNDIQMLYDELEKIYYEEDDAFNSMPEGLQDSIRGEISQEYTDMISAMMSHLNELLLKCQENKLWIKTEEAD